MSKRSYRRLAIVAGAAVALGSMAPAMAAHVTSGGNGSVSVDSIGVTDVTDALPPVALPTAMVSTLAGSLLGTAHAVPALALADAHNVVDDAFGLTGGVLSTGLGAGATGAVDAGLGTVSVNVAGLVNAPVDVLGLVGSSGLVGDTVGAVGGVAGLAVPVALQTAGVATSTAFSTVGTAFALPGTVSGLLSAVLGTSASANVGLLAGVGGIL
jgi:hypothetical protein